MTVNIQTMTPGALSAWRAQHEGVDSGWFLSFNNQVVLLTPDQADKLGRAFLFEGEEDVA